MDVLGLPLSDVLALHRDAPGAAAGVLIGLGFADDDVIDACGAPA